MVVRVGVGTHVPGGWRARERAAAREPVVDCAPGIARGQLRDPEVTEYAERVHADLTLNRIAIVVPAPIERHFEERVVEQLPRPGPAPPPRDLRGHAVDPLLESQIVHFEAGRDELSADTPGPWPADPIENHVPRGPRERGADGIGVEALGVAAL